MSDCLVWPSLPACGPPPVLSTGSVHFPDVKAIKYEGPKSLNPLAFKHYDANEIVEGRKMKDWLRFSVVYVARIGPKLAACCWRQPAPLPPPPRLVAWVLIRYWHTFRGVGADPFGSGTLFRPWEDGTDRCGVRGSVPG